MLVHTALPGHAVGVNAVLWTIALEAHFYLLYPLLIALRRRTGAPGLAVLLVLLSIGSRLAALSLLGRAQQELIDDSFLRRGWEFALGMWVAERIGGETRPWRVGRWAWAGLCLLSLGGGFVLGLWPGGLRVRVLLWPPMFAAAVEAAARWKPGSGLVQRLGCWVGVRSYSLYLVHPVGLALAIWLFRAWTTERGAACALMLASTGILFLVFYAWVERPFAMRARPRRFQPEGSGL